MHTKLSVLKIICLRKGPTPNLVVFHSLGLNDWVRFLITMWDLFCYNDQLSKHYTSRVMCE